MNGALDYITGYNATDKQISRQIGVYLGTRQVISETYTHSSAQVQPNVSFRVVGATEFSLCHGQSATNLSSSIARTFGTAASDWLILLPSSVAPSTRNDTFGWSWAELSISFTHDLPSSQVPVQTNLSWNLLYSHSITDKFILCLVHSGRWYSTGALAAVVLLFWVLLVCVHSRSHTSYVLRPY